MLEELPLFVYGTLRQSEYNHHYLAGKYAQWIPAKLYGYLKIDPLMIIRTQQEADCVEGELYFLQPELYQATMQGCEELEEIPPGATVGEYYRRLQVQVETAVGFYTAWVYADPVTTTP
jgi:gamma-glutamylcyclotransferase (GGCT)/AIG2-like uncharacterized protein YtfP